MVNELGALDVINVSLWESGSSMFFKDQLMSRKFNKINKNQMCLLHQDFRVASLALRYLGMENLIDSL